MASVVDPIPGIFVICDGCGRKWKIDGVINLDMVWNVKCIGCNHKRWRVL